MLRLFRNKRAQNTAEYAILIALVIGVFSAMQIYIRRSLQARIKMGADQIPIMVLGQTGGNVSNQLFGPANFTQYEPYYISKGAYNMTSVSTEGTERGTLKDSGGVRDLGNATSQRLGTQVITGSVNKD